MRRNFTNAVSQLIFISTLIIICNGLEALVSREPQISSEVIDKLTSSWDMNKLFAKYSIIYPILGPGVWFLSIQISNENDAYQKIIEFGEEALSYTPIILIHSKDYHQYDIVPESNLMYIIIDMYYTVIEMPEAKNIPMNDVRLMNVQCQTHWYTRRFIHYITYKH
jgi:hypothetical protein